MWGGSLTAAFRDSVRLLASERRLVAGGLFAYLGYGLWVVVTGRLLQSSLPALDTATVVSLATVQLDSLSLVAVLLWVAVPALVATALLDRSLKNSRGNLESRYRFDHPSALLAPSGLAVLTLVGLTVATGPSPSLLALTAVASAHLFVRTLAYGYRVYTFSVTVLFSVLTVLALSGLAVAWLLHAPTLGALNGTLGTQLAAAGVSSVAGTFVTASGTDAGTLLSLTVLVPAVLSAAYLVPQSILGLAVSLRAPLENPQPRPGQRYPGNTRSVTGHSGDAPDPAATNGSGDTADAASEDPAGSTTDEGENEAEIQDTTERPGTRVFTPDDPIPESDEDDEWYDDTAVFTEDAASAGTPDQCPACRTDLPTETTVSFCPNCGERLD
ncbi:hypothetical protein ACFQJ5_09885 [Halomicroarcula sp. GCM10025324]|uniref:zinc ribbon domain-containing protein n=1 Tax=Haloarcula TaxID=2237 RepID=UPI0023E87B7F|nr:zinc ribbon domain-containing protein [Halomicroarcula sp. ZS-22-S1]